MRREKMRPSRRKDVARRPRETRLFVTLLPAIVFVALTAAGGGTIAAVKYTEKPQFCATCHEMTPYHAAWQAGPHKGVGCVSCHVDPGVVPEYTHKVAALKEVYDHFANPPKFPETGVDVPSSRCVACHTDLPAVTKSGFPHAEHVKQGPCISCHADTGHKVTVEALAAAKLLSNDATSSASRDTTGTHVTVTCTKCHDLKTMTCETCHTAPHVARGTCTTCHSPGPQWAFTHPAAGADCATCHEPPKIHFAGTCSTCHTPNVQFAKTVFKHTSNTCETCHAQPAGHVATNTQVCFTCHTHAGTDWAFSHPAQTSSCAGCHAAPANHFGSDCAGCHKPSTPFAKTVYTHASTDCASCHKPPSGHFHGACATCHNPAMPFAQTKFVHPTSTTCASCHTKPSGHVATSATCYTCHKQRGKSWAFSHPSSSACASCHTPPGNHFGANCASCHTPGRAFANTTFSHPSISAPHGISGKACTACHPGGNYHLVGCSCHGGGNGPSGD